MFGCKRLGHVKIQCSLIKESEKKSKKKAFATWSKSISCNELSYDNICLMTQHEDHEVTSQTFIL